VLPLSAQTRAAMVAYLNAEVIGGGGPLIRSRVRPESGVSPATVGELVKGVMVEAGVKEYVGDGRSAHALRHTCAQDLVDAGADIRKVQRVLRHASIRNTEVYLRGEVKGIREVMAGRTYGGES
jgi:site-specific recombinase XerD